MDLTGKTAIVTGSGRGIGREIALKLAEVGATVVVNDFGVPEPANETVQLIKQLNPNTKIHGLTSSLGILMILLEIRITSSTSTIP